MYRYGFRRTYPFGALDEAKIPKSILVDGKISKQAPLDLPPTTYEVDTPAVAVAAAAASEGRSL